MIDEDLKKLMQDINDFKLSIKDLQKKAQKLEDKVASFGNEKIKSETFHPDFKDPLSVISTEVKESTPPFKPAEKKPKSIEKNIGIKWMVVIGVIAVIIAIVFEIRIAIQKGWITEQVRCLSGVILGFALISTGFFVKNRYKFERYGEVLISGGVVSILTGIYAAHFMFRLIQSYPALCMIAIVAVGSALVGWKTTSKTPLYIGVIGCYLAPFMIKAVGLSAQVLFAYITLLNLGYVTLSVTMRLLSLHFFCLYGSTAIYLWGWYSLSNESPLDWPYAFAYLIIQLLSFSLANLIPSLLKNTPVTAKRIYAFFPSTIIFYYLAGDILLEHVEKWHPFFAFAFLILITLLAQIERIKLKIKLNEHLPSASVVCISVIVLTHLVYINLDSIPLSWALLTIFFYSITSTFFFNRNKILTAASLLLFIYVAIVLNYNFGYAKPQDATMFLNAQFPAFAILIVALFYIALKILKRTDLKSLTLFVAHLFALHILYIEVSRISAATGDYTPFTVTLSWILYTSCFLWLGFLRNSESLRTQAVIMYGLCTVKVFIYDTLKSPTYVKAASYFLLGVALIIAGYYYQKYKKMNAS